jgi:hypothetical protein
VEFPVADQEAHGVVQRLLLGRDRIFEPPDIVFAQVPGGIGGDSGFHEEPGGMNGVQAIAVDRCRICHADPLRADGHIDAGNAGPRALGDLDDTFAGQKLHRTAHGLAADRQHRRQFTLARQLVAALQNTGCDHGDDFVPDHLLGGLLVDRLMKRRER